MALHQSELGKLLIALVDLRQQRTGGHANHRVLGNLPPHLFLDLKAHALGSLRVIGPHIDVHKRPPVLAGDLRTQPVHLVIMPSNGDDIGSVDQRIDDLALLQVRGNEYITMETRGRGIGRHRIGQIARGSAGDGLESEFY